MQMCPERALCPQLSPWKGMENQAGCWQAGLLDTFCYFGHPVIFRFSYLIQISKKYHNGNVGNNGFIQFGYTDSLTHWFSLSYGHQLCKGKPEIYLLGHTLQDEWNWGSPGAWSEGRLEINFSVSLSFLTRSAPYPFQLYQPEGPPPKCLSKNEIGEELAGDSGLAISQLASLFGLLGHQPGHRFKI